MNNELFDKILKSELDKVSVTPSAGLGKSVGAKLFMQNVIIFHKVKAIAALFVIASATTAGIMYSDGDTSQNSSLSQNKEIDISNDQLNSTDNFLSIISLEQNTNSTTVEVVEVNNEKELVNNIVDGGNNKDVGKETIAVDEPVYSQKTNSKLNNKSRASNGAKRNSSSSDTDLTPVNSDVIVTYDNLLSKNSTEEMEVQKIHRMEVSTQLIELDELTYAKLEPLDLPILPKSSRIIVKELSFDLYGLGKGTSDIDNSISNAVYSQYEWDFLKESGALNMESGVGGQVNFAIGTPRVKFKTAIGVNTSKFTDSKATYTYGEVKNQKWLDYFGTDEISWVNTYGEDSCKVCMYASNTENFQKEMKEDKNRYSYVNIPVKAGVELDLKRFSISAFGGIQLSQLVSAKGLGIAKREFLENEKFYYWNDLKVTTLQDDNQLIKNQFLSYQAGVDVRVRILPKLDLLAGYELSSSAGSITNEDNIVSKTIKYQQAKLGLTFHPNRSAIHPKF